MTINHNINNYIISSRICEECDKYTQKFDDDVKKRTIYVFDYSQITLDRKKLENFKSKNYFRIIKHPYVLNYINETVVNSVVPYIIYTLVYFILSVVFYFHIQKPFTEHKTIIIILGPMFLIEWVSN